MADPTDPTDPTDPSLDPLARIFPGPAHLGGAPGRRRRQGARRLVTGGAVAAVLLAGGVAVSSTGSSSPAGYRTAEAGAHAVDQVLAAVATIEPVSQARVAFPVAGTVADVSVAVGDEVLLGDSLAALDETSLVVSLHQAEATLAQAELTLERALAGEDVGGMGPAGGGESGSAPAGASTLTSDTSTSTSTSGSESAGALTSDDGLVGGAVPTVAAVASTTAPAAELAAAPTAAELRAAQQAVLDAQRQVDADLAASQTAYDAAVQVCAAVGTPVETAGTDGEATTTSTTPAQETTTTTSTTSTPAGTDGGLAACQAALQAVLDAQAQVATSEQVVAEAATALTGLLERLAAAAGSGTGSGSGSGAGTGTGTGTGTGSGGDAGSSSGRGSGNGSGSTATTSSPSAAALIAYQKAVDAAAAGVTVADQAIGQATIVSPIDGTVVSVSLAAGDAVTAGSSTATIVVVGAGGYEVTTTVSVADIGDLEVGQEATVVPDGTGDTLTGEVVRIGVAGAGSGSSTTYPVTIGLAGDTSGLGNGATASVGIVTDAVAEALAVPTSAVTTDGDRHTVTVVDGDEASEVTVEVGAIGQSWTEITGGLDAGQEVVLADLSEPLPSSATASSDAGQTSGGGAPSGFPGAGAGGGPPSGFRPGG